jgi:hypothetical protein
MSLEFEAIARKHFGEPNKKQSTKRELRFGKNGSKSVDLEKGNWFDHEIGKGGSLFTLPGEGNGRSSSSPKPQVDIPCDAANDPFKNVVFKKPNKQFRIVKTWPYVDENGAELFEVCRLENGESGADGKASKTYRQRHKDPAEPGQYIDNVKGVRQVPYKLPELVEAIAQSKTVFITEGEKCSDAVISLGGAATCNAMGAGKWPDDLTSFFKNADAVVLPDNDEPGTKHAALVLAKLQGVAKRVRILQLPGLPPKGDVANWIEVGGTLEQLYSLVETDSCDDKSTGGQDPRKRRV